MGIEWRLIFTMMEIFTIITADTGLKRGEYFEIAEVLKLMIYNLYLSGFAIQILQT